jgi:hypothetical protein
MYYRTATGNAPVHPPKRYYARTSTSSSTALYAENTLSASKGGGNDSFPSSFLFLFSKRRNRRFSFERRPCPMKFHPRKEADSRPMMIHLRVSGTFAFVRDVSSEMSPDSRVRVSQRDLDRFQNAVTRANRTCHTTCVVFAHGSAIRRERKGQAHPVFLFITYPAFLSVLRYGRLSLRTD